VNHHRLHRILRLVTLLRSRRFYTAAELAGHLGVTRRTVFRDLNILELAGVPYHWDAEQRGFRIADSYFLPPVSFTLEEALSLLTLVRTQQADRGIPFLLDGLRAFQKIESMLPAQMQEQVADLAKRIDYQVGPLSPYEGFDRTYVTLRNAMIARQAQRCRYDSLHEEQVIETVIEPYVLFFCRRAWYVAANSHMHKQVRTFKVSRFRHLEDAGRSFRIPRGFSMDKYLGNAWSLIGADKSYRVKIRFSPMVARTVADTMWHRTQNLAMQKDGGLLFRATVDGLDEILWWILGYGEHAEVLAPAELRQRVKASVEQMARTYDASPPSD